MMIGEISMNWTNHKRINTVFVVGIIFLLIGVFGNEFIMVFGKLSEEVCSG